jgi:hypothetical protein
MDGGLEYVQRTPDQFLETYRYFLEKHTIGPWHRPSLVVLAVAGNKILAKHVLRKIFNPQYRPPNTNITLEHHEVNNGPITINISEAIMFLFKFCHYENTDESELFNDSLIQAQMVLWDEFSKAAPDEVDIFDRTMWPEGKNYEPLHDLIMSEVVLLASHQQRIENYLQMAAHLSQTGIGESRCSWRAICNVAIMQPFNQHALEKAKAKKATAAEKDKVKRVKGRQLLEYLSEYETNFLDDCDAAYAELDEAKTKKIKSELRNKENKASAVQNNATIKKISKTINAKRKNPKGMTKTGIDVPAGVGGAVMMKYIAYTHMDGKDNANRILRAELKVRKIEFSDKLWDAMD